VLHINAHSVKRFTGKCSGRPISRYLSGFCEASTKDYECVLYLRLVYNDTSVNTSAASKEQNCTCEDPEHTSLELCGALILSTLLTRVAADWQLNIESGIAWTN